METIRHKVWFKSTEYPDLDYTPHYPWVGDAKDLAPPPNSKDGLKSLGASQLKKSPQVHAHGDGILSKSLELQELESKLNSATNHNSQWEIYEDDNDHSIDPDFELPGDSSG